MEKIITFAEAEIGNTTERIRLKIKYEKNKNKKLVLTVENYHNSMFWTPNAIRTYKKNMTKKQELILRLWEEYNHNDLTPECEHQRQRGWNDLAKKTVTETKWLLTEDAYKKKDQTKRDAINALKKGMQFNPTKEQTFITNLQDELITYDDQKIDSTLTQYYGKAEENTTTRQWLFNADYEKGLRLKPCPECNYKYGSKWLYREIPKEDEKLILELLR